MFIAALTMLALTVASLAAAVGAWLLNNLTVPLIVFIVGYLVYLERTYGAQLIAWTIGQANALLHLHLTRAEEETIAAAIERKVYAAQKTFAVPADRRAAVLGSILKAFPGADEAHVGVLIDAAVACARLQHGRAWDALAPATEDAPAPALDVEALKKEAFAAGQQAILSLISSAVQVPTPTTQPAPVAESAPAAEKTATPPPPQGAQGGVAPLPAL